MIKSYALGSIVIIVTIEIMYLNNIDIEFGFILIRKTVGYLYGLSN